MSHAAEALTNGTAYSTCEVPTSNGTGGGCCEWPKLRELVPNGKNRIRHTMPGCSKCTLFFFFLFYTQNPPLFYCLCNHTFSEAINLESNLLGCSYNVQSGFQLAALLPQPFSSYYLDQLCGLLYRILVAYFSLAIKRHCQSAEMVVIQFGGKANSLQSLLITVMGRFVEDFRWEGLERVHGIWSRAFCSRALETVSVGNSDVREEIHFMPLTMTPSIEIT